MESGKNTASCIQKCCQIRSVDVSILVLYHDIKGMVISNPPLIAFDILINSADKRSAAVIVGFMSLGKKVYFRYDPENLSEVRIYDLEDRYIMSVPADNTAVLSYNASKDDVKAAMAKTRRLERIAREYKENAILADVDKITAMELVLKQAERNKANYQGKPNPSLLEVQRADEEPVFKKVVGGADLDVMNRNAAIRRGGK